MNDFHPSIDWAAINNAVAHLAAVRPAYASILGFYGPVFVAQLEAVAETSPAAIDIDASLLEMKSKEGFSLIEPAAFPIDLPAARKLLRKICHIAASTGEKLKGTGQALLKAMDAGLVANDCFGEALLKNGQLSSLADQLGVAADMISLLIYLAAKPSVEKDARRLASRLASDHAEQSYCPICGSAPIIGELNDEGRQWLHCGLCWHRWPAKRLACPFCSNRDSDKLEYIFSDDEPEYRVNLCGECRRYLKVVDIRKLDRLFYPPLEQVASLHLDMLATEKGYCHAVTSKS
jgi:FdhE protein